MVEGRTEAEGEYVAWLIHCIPAAIWSPKDLPRPEKLNPFKTPEPVSEAMRLHLERWERRRWAAVMKG